ncbi:MAG: hypothetical protein ACFFG0_07865 [Candidatus Thorarchaeota archaeon]
MGRKTRTNNIKSRVDNKTTITVSSKVSSVLDVITKSLDLKHTIKTEDKLGLTLNDTIKFLINNCNVINLKDLGVEPFKLDFGEYANEN